MKAVALVVVLVCACSALELRPQFPGMFPAMPQMGLGQLPFPQMGMGMGMGQIPQIPNFGMGQFPQIPLAQFGQFPQFGAQVPHAPQALPVNAAAHSQASPVVALSAAPAAPAAPAPAPAPAAVPAVAAPAAPAAQPAVPAQISNIVEAAKSAISALNLPKAAQAPSQPAQAQVQVPSVPQIPVADIAKWAESMGLPKLSEKDLGRLVEMQQSMVSRLQSLPQNDIHEMRTQQSKLADEMDSLLVHPSDSGIEKFQATQEQLMNQWAQKLGLPAVSAEEHNMMRTQLRVMFDKMTQLPQNQLEELRNKHEQIKTLMQQASS